MGVDGSANDLADRLRPAVITLRIIVLAMAGGVLVFACIAAVIRRSQPRPAIDVVPLLTSLAIVLAPLALLARGFVPALLVKRGRARIAAGKFELPAHPRAGIARSLSELGDAGKFFMVYQTQAIIAAAQLEAVAFLSIAAFLINGSVIALALGVLLAAAIVATVPRMPRVVQWIHEQLRLMGEEKLLVR